MHSPHGVNEKSTWHESSSLQLQFETETTQSMHANERVILFRFRRASVPRGITWRSTISSWSQGGLWFRGIFYRWILTIACLKSKMTTFNVVLCLIQCIQLIQGHLYRWILTIACLKSKMTTFNVGLCLIQCMQHFQVDTSATQWHLKLWIK